MQIVEQEVTNGGLEHMAEVTDAMKALKKIDGFMYASGAIKSSLDEGFTLGQIGIFALDCIVADGDATSGGIGKVPLTDMGEIVEKSSLIWQGGSLTYTVKILEERGLSVYVWAFIGDDDFKYSVSPEYSVSNPEVRDTLQLQVATLQTALTQELSQTCAATHVEGWLVQENQLQVAEVRASIASNMLAALQTNTLPQKALKRLEHFVEWRIEVITEAGLDPNDFQDIIMQQAIEEMSSFVVQGLLAPSVVQAAHPDLPLIFVNTYPNLGIQNLDDECIRLGKGFGIEGYTYGTIHAPGPAKLAKFLGQAQPKKLTQAFGCGETKARKQQERVLWQNILTGTGGGE